MRLSVSRSAGSARATILRALSGRKTVPKVRGANPAVSPGAEAIIHKCLAPEPENRYPSALALRDEERFFHMKTELLHLVRRTAGAEP